MTDRELEQKLAEAVNRMAPDDLDAILSRCGGQKRSVTELNELKQNQNIIDVDAVVVKPKKKWGRWLAAACAALVLVGGGGGVYYHQSYAVASVVSLDVNPSIELKVNRGERVISCAALNQEGAAVLFDMDGGADLKGTKLDVAVNAIVGALVREGYLDSISSAILISVEDNDQERAARLQAELVASVDGVLQVQAPGTSVLSQTFTMDAEAPALEYMTFDSGISTGKAALVRKVMEMNGTIALNSTTTFDKLAALSVEELNDLLETGEKRIPIGKSAAAMAVETYAGTAALNSATTDVDPELDENPPHYEVELHTAFGEFEYIVDAFTGEILSGQKDILNQPSDTPVVPDPVPETPSVTPQPPNTQTPAPSGEKRTPIGRSAAARAAEEYAGTLAIDSVTTDVDEELDEAVPHYEVELETPWGDFDYIVDAYTGEILSGQRDIVSGRQTAQDVGQEAAKQAALAHAGLSAADVTNWDIERDWDDGRLEYEIEFWCGTTEYEYTIDGHSCAVLEHELDHHTYGSHHSSGHHG